MISFELKHPYSTLNAPQIVKLGPIKKNKYLTFYSDFDALSKWHEPDITQIFFAWSIEHMNPKFDENNNHKLHPGVFPSWTRSCSQIQEQIDQKIPWNSFKNPQICCQFIYSYEAQDCKSVGKKRRTTPKAQCQIWSYIFEFQNIFLSYLDVSRFRANWIFR